MASGITKKVAFIGPIDQGTGYCKSVISYISSLQKNNVEVAARNIKMTQTKGYVPNQFKWAMTESLDNIDSVIQYNLPSEYLHKGGVQNIGFLTYETNRLVNDWPFHLNLMDKVFVPAGFLKQTCLNSGVTKPVYVTKQGVDVSKFSQQYKTFSFELPKNCVKFYSIAEISRRKNIAALLAAYTASFNGSDNVILIIKSSSPDRDTKKAYGYVREMVEDLRQKMGKVNPPRVIIIPEYLSENDTMSLHKSCDVFVSTSFGEAVCLPLLDANGFGNKTIVPASSAFLDYKSNKTILVETTETVVFGGEQSGHRLYQPEEKWWNVSLLGLSAAMKKCVEEHSGEKDKSIQEYTFDNFNETKTGSILKDAINA